MIGSFLRRLARDRRGAAAVEFGVVVPVIAAMAATSFVLWDFADKRQDMRAALKVGATYYLNGGTNDATAVTLAQQGWRDRPADGVITTVRTCRCGEAVAVCTGLCPGNKPPAIYVTLAASAVTATGEESRTVQDSTVVRVR